MDRIEWMREFVTRADRGEVDAAEFVDNCNTVIDAFRTLVYLQDFEDGKLKKHDTLKELSSDYFQ